MFELIYLRLLSGIKIKYSWRDLYNYIRFQRSSFSINEKAKVSLDASPMRVFVISLDFRHDRRLEIVEQFKQLKIPFEFFNAIHGKSQREMVFKTIPFGESSKKYLSCGSVGCIASHRLLWEKLTYDTSE